MDVLPWHIPGLQLVAEGINGASRAGDDLGHGLNVQSALGPVVSDGLWSKVQEVSASVGWHITVDAFASASNARAARYWSEFPESGSDAVDALSVPDLASSTCQVCGQAHREVVYAFPSPVMLQPALAKAIADRARCILVVPVAIVAPHWHKLPVA